MRIKHGIWVIIADSEKYIVLINQGSADMLDLRVEYQGENDNPATHEQGSDRPGRFASPHGRGADVPAARSMAHGRVSALQETDWHQLAKKAAAHDMAEKINRWAHSNDCAAMVLAMDPKTLGVVRGNLTARAKSKIVDEIAKDFTNHTVEHIERLLSED